MTNGVSMDHTSFCFICRVRKYIHLFPYDSFNKLLHTSLPLFRVYKIINIRLMCLLNLVFYYIHEVSLHLQRLAI